MVAGGTIAGLTGEDATGDGVVILIGGGFWCRDGCCTGSSSYTTKLP